MAALNGVLGALAGQRADRLALGRRAPGRC